MTRHFKTAAFLTMAAIVGAGAAAAALGTERTVTAGHACLSVGPNVCFSGSTDWVAKAAGRQLLAGQHMDQMVADAN